MGNEISDNNSVSNIKQRLGIHMNYNDFVSFACSDKIAWLPFNSTWIVEGQESNSAWNNAYIGVTANGYLFIMRKQTNGCDFPMNDGAKSWLYVIANHALWGIEDIQVHWSKRHKKYKLHLKQTYDYILGDEESIRSIYVSDETTLVTDKQIRALRSWLFDIMISKRFTGDRVRNELFKWTTMLNSAIHFSPHDLHPITHSHVKEEEKKALQAGRRYHC